MKINLQEISVRNGGRGRPVSDKTARVRSAVLRAISLSEENLSTKDIAKKTKQSKLQVSFALRWAEQHGHIQRVGSQKHSGAGRPMYVWSA